MRWVMTASVVAAALALAGPALARENSELKVFDENNGTYGSQVLITQPPAVIYVAPPVVPQQTTKVGGEMDIRR